MFLSRRENSWLTRCGTALLVLLMFIAPTWHVCEMSGDVCCPPPGKTVKEKLVCHTCPPGGQAEQHEQALQEFAVGASHSPYGGTCLAKLLMAMPGQFGAAPEQVLLSPQVFAYRLQEHRLPSFASQALPPVRGPPAFSL